MTDFFSLYHCRHCGKPHKSAYERWAHQRKAHPAQEGLPTKEFRGKGDGEPKPPEPKSYSWFGSNPPQALLEHETLRMSNPENIIKRKSDNWGILEDVNNPPHRIVRSKYTQGASEEDVAYRVSLMKQARKQEREEKETVELVESLIEQVEVAQGPEKQSVAQQLAELFGR